MLRITVFSLIHSGLVLFSSGAFAAPVVTGVSGTFASGSSVIVQGTGFGQKSPALPRLWDDFEGHPVGSLVSSPLIGQYTSTYNNTYSDQQCYRGQRCAFGRRALAEPDRGPGLVSHWIPLEAQNSFASMKVKIISAYGTVAPHNIKLLRLNAHSPDPTHGYPNYNIGKERGALSFVGIANHGSLGQFYFGPGGVLLNPAGWNSVSLWDHIGDPDTPNGWVGYSWGHVRAETAHDRITLRSGGDFLSGIRSSYFCAYVSHDGYDVDVYLDDLYSDTSLARIEIQAGSGNYEMQLPTAWEADSVTFTANTGNYPSGSQVQLVIYDPEGQATAPLSLEVGRTYGGDSTAPGAPSNLRVPPG